MGKRLMYSDMSLEKLLEELKKDKKNNDLIEFVKKQINLKSNSIERIEAILDVMEKVNFYIGFNNETIKKYLEDIKIPSLNMEKERIFKELKLNNKVKYIKHLLHHEQKGFEKVKLSGNGDLKRKMLKEKKYVIIDIVLEVEDKEFKKKI